MTPLERMVAAEHQRQEAERMAEIHEGLGRAAHDVGALVAFAVADALLLRQAGFATTIRTHRKALAGVGAWRAAWCGGR